MSKSITTDGNKVTIICQATGSLARVSPQAAELAGEIDELPVEDQTLMLTMIRMMAAGTWPYDTEEMKSWTPEQFRAAMASLPARQ